METLIKSNSPVYHMLTESKSKAEVGYEAGGGVPHDGTWRIMMGHSIWCNTGKQTGEETNKQRKRMKEPGRKSTILLFTNNQFSF